LASGAVVLAALLVNFFASAICINTLIKIIVFFFSLMKRSKNQGLRKKKLKIVRRDVKMKLARALIQFPAMCDLQTNNNSKHW
jgi:hypothetical protein